ncbi:MAG: hypothetical protein LBD36_01150 [Holosporales bacterium]|nr:hypothetical protein [Holosporales bacterium]
MIHKIKNILIIICTTFVTVSNVAYSQSIVVDLLKIANILGTTGTIKSNDQINPIEYQQTAHSLIQAASDTHDSLTECFAKTKLIYTDSFYESFIDVLQQNQDTISDDIHRFANAIQGFCSLINGDTLPILDDLSEEQDPLFFAILRAFQSINTSLDIFLSANERLEHKVYTNFECIERINFLIYALTIWIERCRHIQQIETTLDMNPQNVHAIKSINLELSNCSLKLETLNRKYTRLEQAQSLQKIQELLNNSLTRSVDGQIQSIQDYIKLKLTLDSMPDTTDCGCLIFDQSSIPYKISNLYYNILALMKSFGVQCVDMCTTSLHTK